MIVGYGGGVGTDVGGCSCWCCCVVLCGVVGVLVVVLCCFLTVYLLPLGGIGLFSVLMVVVLGCFLCFIVFLLASFCGTGWCCVFSVVVEVLLVAIVAILFHASDNYALF